MKKITYDQVISNVRKIKFNRLGNKSGLSVDHKIVIEALIEVINQNIEPPWKGKKIAFYNDTALTNMDNSGMWHIKQDSPILCEKEKGKMIEIKSSLNTTYTVSKDFVYLLEDKEMVYLSEDTAKIDYVCNQCGNTIKFTGKYWEHTGLKPRHIAMPKPFLSEDK